MKEEVGNDFDESVKEEKPQKKQPQKKQKKNQVKQDSEENYSSDGAIRMGNGNH